MRLSNAILGFTVLCALVALTLSIWPGWLGDILFLALFLSIVASPLALVAFPIGAYILCRSGRLALPSQLSYKSLAAIALVGLFTVVLLAGNVPRRIAFALSRSAFESAQLSPKQDGRAEFHQRLGIYWVDEVGVDPRGGRYFRVFEGIDGIGPDRTSYGFVQNPNSQGSPFGAAHYKTHHLSGDWYWFCASDDWF